MEFIIWLIVIAIFAGAGYFFYKIFKTSFKRIGEIEKINPISTQKTTEH